MLLQQLRMSVLEVLQLRLFTIRHPEQDGGSWMHDLDLPKGHPAARLCAWGRSYLRCGYLCGARIYWLNNFFII